MDRRRAEARTHAEELARRIADVDESVVRIWGFGSVFDTRLPFRESSGIDLSDQAESMMAAIVGHSDTVSRGVDFA